MGSEAWKPPDSFVRATTKYWIRPENIVRVDADPSSGRGSLPLSPAALP